MERVGPSEFTNGNSSVKFGSGGVNVQPTLGQRCWPRKLHEQHGERGRASRLLLLVPQQVQPFADHMEILPVLPGGPVTDLSYTANSNNEACAASWSGKVGFGAQVVQSLAS